MGNLLIVTPLAVPTKALEGSYGYVNKKQILIIEDDDDLREIVQLSLELVTNWEIMTASSVTEGLALATDTQPLAILLSVSMPNLNGFNTFQEIKANRETNNIPVILMADRVRLADKCQFTQQGVAAVVVSPSDPVDLAREISKVLSVNY